MRKGEQMTDLPQNDFDPLRKKVYALADSLLSNAITSEEAKSLGELVCNDAEARRHYVRFMHKLGRSASVEFPHFGGQGVL